MSSPFLLAPWEVVRGGHMERRLGEVEVEIEAPETSPFRGKLLVSTMKGPFRPLGTLWFRPQASKEEGNFIIAESDVLPARRFKALEQFGGEEKFDVLLPGALRDDSWGRLYFLNSKGNLVNEDKFATWQLLVLANGRASWQKLPGDGSLLYDPYAVTAFVWSETAQPATLARMSAWQFWEESGSELWAQEDAIFARQWADLNDDERRECILTCKHGSLQELERMTQLVVWSDADLWRQNEWLYWRLTLNQRQRHNSTTPSVDLNGANINLEGHGRKTTTARFIAWKNVLIKYFAPQRSTQSRKHSCVDEWIRSASIQTPFLSIDRPTAHEMLEAGVELKEWARIHLPPKLLATVESFDR